MNINDGTLYRRIEDLVFICDSMEAALDMASDILVQQQSKDGQAKDAAMSLYGIVTNIRHVRRELNDTLDKIGDGVITESASGGFAVPDDERPMKERIAAMERKFHRIGNAAREGVEAVASMEPPPFVDVARKGAEAVASELMKGGERSE